MTYLLQLLGQHLEILLVIELICNHLLNYDISIRVLLDIEDTAVPGLMTVCCMYKTLFDMFEKLLCLINHF